MLKFAIVVLFFSIIASLSSGFLFLIKDMGVSDSKRTVIALAIRISLATLLMILIGYGLQSGKLRSSAPWENSTHGAQPENASRPAH